MIKITLFEYIPEVILTLIDVLALFTVLKGINLLFKFIELLGAGSFGTVIKLILALVGL